MIKLSPRDGNTNVVRVQVSCLEARHIDATVISSGVNENAYMQVQRKGGNNDMASA